MSLYHISTEMQSILDAMLDGGVDSPQAMAAMDQHLQGLEVALESKADAYAGVIRELELRATARTEEVKRIRALADADATLAQRLRERLRDVMAATGMTRIDTPRFRLSVVGNGGRQPLLIADPEAIPPLFIRNVPEINREAIRLALDAGQEVPGCSLAPRGSRLSIK